MASVADKIKIEFKVSRMMADLFTPVGLYAGLRTRFQESVLLESTDYHSRENSFSFIGLNPIAGLEVEEGVLKKWGLGLDQRKDLNDNISLVEEFNKFLNGFEFTTDNLPFEKVGLLGYSSFEACQYFDTIKIEDKGAIGGVPLLKYQLYQYVFAFDHYRDELTLIEVANDLAGSVTSNSEASGAEELIAFVNGLSEITFEDFKRSGEEKSNLSDRAFKEMVAKGKRHCQLGDVFQVVFSRQFSQEYTGDDFQVYRVLRSVNPSPYLFYFDFNGFRIFGSSPEAQIVVKENEVSINPIAGTYKRTGNDLEDLEKAKALAGDVKENAEHMMLVDLARNDLGKHASDITIPSLKQIQYYSHVIHLVSEVKGKLNNGVSPFQVFGDTFPAGTLSGAPKYKALELINRYERQSRSVYGGAIGIIGFKGNINQAIIIRTFLSKGNCLYYQAGAGIVVNSNEENELQEVNNKLGALKKAIELAEKIS